MDSQPRIMASPANADESDMVQTTMRDSGLQTCVSGGISGFGWREFRHRPGAFCYAILTSGRAWLLAAILLLSLVLIVLPITRAAINRAFPPTRDSKLFGLVKKEKPSAVARGVSGMFAIAMLAGVGVVVVRRFRGQLPDGLAAAERRSRQWERQADALLTVNWQRSRRLYQGAALLTLDEERTIRLQRRAKALRGDPESDATAISTATAASTAVLPATDLPLSGSIGPESRYALEQKLGEGAMGVVYRGRDRVLERAVAIKQLSGRLTGDAQYIARFTLEARALARLSHPNIVQVYDFVTVDGAVWMVLEYIDSGTLADMLKSRGRLDPAEAAAIIAGVAEGLALAHGAGIVHRDIKPANILLTADGKPKLTDFGIAKLAAAVTLTQAGATLGSPAYMSPEQCNGEGLDARSDIYSLGITLYELLSGRPPFAGDTTGILAQHMVATPAPMGAYAPGIPEELERLVGMMLLKKRDERIQSMGDVRKELVAFLAGMASGRTGEPSSMAGRV